MKASTLDQPGRSENPYWEREKFRAKKDDPYNAKKIGNDMPESLLLLCQKTGAIS